MKKHIYLQLMLLLVVSAAVGQTTYTGLFHSTQNGGAVTDDFLNIVPKATAISTNSWNIKHQNGNSLFRVFFAASTPSVQVGAGEATNFTVNGSVGLGTTTPLYPLHVVSPGATQQAHTFPAAVVASSAGDLDAYAGITISNTKAASFLGARARDNAGAPAAVLVDDVLTGLYGSGHTGTGWTGNTGAIRIMAAENFSGSAQGTKIEFLTTPSGSGGGSRATRMMISPGGNVGIGTILPDGLQINSALSQESSRGVDNVRMGVLSGSPRIILDNSGSTPFEIDNNGKFRIFNPGYDRFVITSDGNVGIGSSNPDAKLTVKGIIHTEEVKVDLTVPGPDYVFEPNYNLPTLAETEAYIKANKHLPEVPSAKEMEANGINLSEMNMLLLKKVEELTLHSIEMNKKLEMLMKENEAQNKLIQNLQQKK